MFAASFAPAGWAFCNGQLLPISENDALFVVLGTMYGGDGQETFALPNLQSRVPIHFGTGGGGGPYQCGDMAGTESVTLTTQQIPIHTHPLMATTATGQLSPGNAILTVPTGSQPGLRTYNNTLAPNTTLRPESIQPTGGSQPHENMQPYLVISFIISLYGLFPSPN